MRITSLESVKDCYRVISSNNSVLLFGKNLWIFRSDGTFVAKHKAIRNPYKCAFLPNSTAIVDGGGDGAYHYLSLETGEILWSTIKKRRRLGSSYRFAVSPDGTTVYDICNIGYNEFLIDCLQPLEKNHCTYVTKETLRVIDDIFCDESGRLCVLQSHLIIDPDNPRESSTHQNGILLIDNIDGKLAQAWIHWWTTNKENYRTMRGCDGKYVLYEDLTVLDLETKETFSLLENDCVNDLPRDGFTWRYEKERGLLIVSYIGEPMSVIIDCKNRKRAAQYVESKWTTKGGLVRNEFWSGTENGVVRKPFPLFESKP